MVHLVYSSRLTLRVMPSIIGRIYHPELDLERKSSELGDGPMAPTSASPLFHCLYGLYLFTYHWDYNLQLTHLWNCDKFGILWTSMISMNCSPSDCRPSGNDLFAGPAFRRSGETCLEAVKQNSDRWILRQPNRGAVSGNRWAFQWIIRYIIDILK